MVQADVILRFRELTLGIDTISEHLRMQADAGYVWWGWWKKDTELHAVAHLQRVAQRTRAGGVTACLIDTSAERMHLASVAEIVIGPLPESEWKFVPAYYRGDSSVAAWFKFESIQADVSYDPDVEAQIGQSTIALGSSQT